MLLVLLIRIRLLFFKNCIFYFTFKGSLYLICPGPLNVQGQPAYKASKGYTTHPQKNTRKPLSTTHLQTAGTPETAAQKTRPSNKKKPNSKKKKKKNRPEYGQTQYKIQISL
jgi:hypothetical protein